jgi:MFS superfamily sulfate permease-like transporter
VSTLLVGAIGIVIAGVVRLLEPMVPPLATQRRFHRLAILLLLCGIVVLAFGVFRMV